MGEGRGGERAINCRDERRRRLTSAATVAELTVAGRARTNRRRVSPSHAPHAAAGPAGTAALRNFRFRLADNLGLHRMQTRTKTALARALAPDTLPDPSSGSGGGW
jgi:hypothetical protein